MFGRRVARSETNTAISLVSRIKPTTTRDITTAKERGKTGLLSSQVFAEAHGILTPGGSVDAQQLTRLILSQGIKQAFAMLRLSVMFVGKQKILKKIWDEYYIMAERQRSEHRTSKLKDDGEFEDNVDMDRPFLLRMLKMFDKTSNIWVDVAAEFEDHITHVLTISEKNVLDTAPEKSLSLDDKRQRKQKMDTKCEKSRRSQPSLHDMLMRRLPKKIRKDFLDSFSSRKVNTSKNSKHSFEYQRDSSPTILSTAGKLNPKKRFRDSDKDLFNHRHSKRSRVEFERKDSRKRRRCEEYDDILEDASPAKKYRVNYRRTNNIKRRRDESATNDDETPPTKKLRVRVDVNFGCCCDFEGLLKEVARFVASELHNTDIKREVSNLRNEILTMDVESGQINTNRLSGDERFEAMLFCLDTFEWSREDTQVEIHDEMMLVLLPVIYGPEWMSNYEHIMTKYEVLKYMAELIIICARRWGKTIGCAMMAATLLLFIPSLISIVFSNCQRQSTKFMQEAVKLLSQSPFMATCKIIQSGQEVLRIKHFGNERRMEALPARLEVCDFFYSSLVPCFC